MNDDGFGFNGSHFFIVVVCTHTHSTAAAAAFFDGWRTAPGRELWEVGRDLAGATVGRFGKSVLKAAGEN